MRAASIKMQSHHRLTFLHSNPQRDGPFFPPIFLPVPRSPRGCRDPPIPRERTILSHNVFGPEISCQSVARAVEEKKNFLAFLSRTRETGRSIRHRKEMPVPKPAIRTELPMRRALLSRNKFCPCTLAFTPYSFLLIRTCAIKSI